MQDRKSNFELLRIVSMIMIIVAHYCYYGGVLSNGSGLNYAIAVFFKTGGKLGVTCFVLITGYFMCEKNFHFSAFLKIIMQSLFIALLCFFIYIGIFGNPVSLRIFIKSISSPFVLGGGGYWFVAAYLALYLCIPFLNIIYERINHSPNYVKTLIMLGLLLIFIPGVDYIKWFCFLYLVGAFFRSNPLSTIKCKTLFLIFLCSIILIWVSVWGITFVASITQISEIANAKYYFSKLNSPLILSSGISLFLIFRNFSFSSSKINYLAKLSFAIYLIHENFLLRNYIWKDIFQTESFINKPSYEFILHIIICVVSIYMVTIVIEFFRQPIEKVIFSNKKILRLNDSINSLLNL